MTARKKELPPEERLRRGVARAKMPLDAPQLEKLRRSLGLPTVEVEIERRATAQ